MVIEKCEPGLAEGGERKAHEAIRDGGRAERQANRATQNAAGHHD